MRRSAEIDAALEAAAVSAALLEERLQLLNVVAGDVTAIGAPRQRGENPLRTRLFLGHRLRPAREDPSPARRVSRSGRLERSGQDHFVDVRAAREVNRVRGAAHVGFETTGVQRVGLLDERDGDRARTSLERHARGEAAVHRVAGRRRVVARRGHLLVAAERRQVHALPVHADLELMRILQPAHRPEVGAEQTDLELVLAIERQVGLDLDAAHRAERQAVDLAILRGVLSDAIELADRRRLRIANRQRCDALGGAEVTLEQHRRHAEHVGVVVEPAARIVRRQHRGDIDVERQQIANGVGVLGAIEAMGQRAARVRIRARRVIERRLERRDQRPTRGLVGPGQTSGGHHARPHFSNHVLPDIGVRRHVGQVRHIEREAARSQALVMAGDAVLVDRGACVVARRRGLGGTG